MIAVIEGMLGERILIVWWRWKKMSLWEIADFKKPKCAPALRLTLPTLSNFNSVCPKPQSFTLRQPREIRMRAP